MSYTKNNVENVRNLIDRKINSEPSFANNLSVTNVTTDFDHFPYSRWYRGVYYFPEPIVAEREAGYRQIHNSCYNVIRPFHPDENPNLCFEAPCSTIFPCFPEYLTKYADKDKLDVMVNKACILQYR